MSELLTNLLSDVSDDTSGETDSESTEVEDNTEGDGDSTSESDESTPTEEDSEEDETSEEESSEDSEDSEDEGDEEDEVENLHFEDDTIMEFDGQEVELGELKQAYKDREELRKWAHLLRDEPIQAMVQLVGAEKTQQHIEKFIENLVAENNMSDEDKKVRDAEHRVQEAEKKAKELEAKTRAAQEEQAVFEYRSFLDKEINNLFKEHNLEKNDVAWELMKFNIYQLHENENRVATVDDLNKFIKTVKTKLGVKSRKPKAKLPPAPGSPGSKKGNTTTKKAKPRVSMRDYFDSLSEGRDILSK